MDNLFQFLDKILPLISTLLGAYKRLIMLKLKAIFYPKIEINYPSTKSSFVFL